MILPFIMEYVRRLNILIPDLIWLFQYEGNTFYQGRPILIKRRPLKLPSRATQVKDVIPRYVREVLGIVDEPPLQCLFCGRSDVKVTPQFYDKEVKAH
ncbi:MAG: hypothetical protein QXX95_03405 [Nitrososphaerales archaeon]